jgi:hypothetical protein
MFDDDEEDENGTFGMLMGLMLFLVVGGLLIGSTMPPSAQSAAVSYSRSR